MVNVYVNMVSKREITFVSVSQFLINLLWVSTYLT